MLMVACVSEKREEISVKSFWFHRSCGTLTSVVYHTNKQKSACYS